MADSNKVSSVRHETARSLVPGALSYTAIIVINLDRLLFNYFDLFTQACKKLTESGTKLVDGLDSIDLSSVNTLFPECAITATGAGMLQRIYSDVSLVWSTAAGLTPKLNPAFLETICGIESMARMNGAIVKYCASPYFTHKPSKAYACAKRRWFKQALGPTVGNSVEFFEDVHLLNCHIYVDDGALAERIRREGVGVNCKYIAFSPLKNFFCFTKMANRCVYPISASDPTYSKVFESTVEAAVEDTIHSDGCLSVMDSYAIKKALREINRHRKLMQFLYEVLHTCGCFQELLHEEHRELAKAVYTHDASKYEPEEFFAGQMYRHKFASNGIMAIEKAKVGAIQLHYALNAHHPEHFVDGKAPSSLPNGHYSYASGVLPNGRMTKVTLIESLLDMMACHIQYDHFNPFGWSEYVLRHPTDIFNVDLKYFQRFSAPERTSLIARMAQFRLRAKQQGFLATFDEHPFVYNRNHRPAVEPYAKLIAVDPLIDLETSCGITFTHSGEFDEFYAEFRGMELDELFESVAGRDNIEKRMAEMNVKPQEGTVTRVEKFFVHGEEVTREEADKEARKGGTVESRFDEAPAGPTGEELAEDALKAKKEREEFIS